MSMFLYTRNLYIYESILVIEIAANPNSTQLSAKPISQGKAKISPT